MVEQAISEKVLSFKFNSYIAEIETVDSLASYKEGVFIVVTGCLTANDNVQRKFTQSFFLAPQEKGYFVLNDIFRFVDQSQPGESNQILASEDNDDAPKAPLIAAPGTKQFSFYPFFMIDALEFVMMHFMCQSRVWFKRIMFRTFQLRL